MNNVDDDGTTNVQLYIANALRQVDGDQAAVLEATLQRLQSSAEILVQSFHFHRSFWCYLIDQLLEPRHILVLSKQHSDVLENTLLDDPGIAAERFFIMSHIMFIEEIVKSYKMSVHNVAVTMSRMLPSEYILTVEDKRVLHGQRVVVCKTADLGSQYDFNYYYGTTEAHGEFQTIRCGHVDSTDKPGNFMIGNEISIFFPPFDHFFEATQHVVEAIKTDVIFRAMFYPNLSTRHASRFSLPNQALFHMDHLNPSQLAAVRGIIYHDPSVAFVCVGPPGTGKTEVLRCAVSQTILSNPESRILICTSANVAADVIALRLIRDQYIPEDSVLRIYSPGYTKRQEKKEEIYAHSLVRGKRFYIPHDTTQVARHRVIICTLNVVTKLRFFGKHYFDYIYIDEAGQCLEMESMIPAALFAGPKTRVSFIGDPKQLSPFFADGILRQERFQVTATSIGRLSMGINTSRNSSLLVTLNINYRSHPEIVLHFSKLFYGNAVKSADIHSLELHRYSPPYFNITSRHPIRFHVCYGNENPVVVNEKPSFSNQREIQLVAKYIKEIFAVYGKEADIGVISPYRGQVLAIRKELAFQHIAGIDVDSVNKFQGDQRSIILVSLVRSSKIGFLKEFRRLNVAISRPQHLLIVIGNLHLLHRSNVFHSYAQLLWPKKCIYDEGCTAEEWYYKLAGHGTPFRPSLFE